MCGLAPAVSGLQIGGYQMRVQSTGAEAFCRQAAGALSDSPRRTGSEGAAPPSGRVTTAMAKQQVLPAFVTPIWSSMWDDSAELNAGLRRMILARAPEAPQTHRSNIGGWHSEQDLLRWQEPEVPHFVERIKTGINAMTQATNGLQEAAAGGFMMVAWANLLYQGGYNQVHDHNRYAWSGVYYVDIGDETPGDDLSGRIEFIDPRVGIGWPKVPGDPFKQRTLFKPEAGRMFMFPGWLRHYVHPYKGEKPRISIAFNVAFNEPGESGKRQP